MLKATPENINMVSGQCHSTADQIDGELSSLKAYVVSLQDTWHGVAANNFGTLMQDFDTFGRMLHEALVNIGDGLKGNSVNYVDTENANIASLQGINGDIPGARL
jgi:WXG100 family type VII secretion target